MTAAGLIFSNIHDESLPELTRLRTMASVPFGGRYRLIDFILSSMVNCGIDNISILVRQNYHSLMDHLGSGREWDLTRKNGGLTIFPPYSEKNTKVYTGRVEALASILGFLKHQKEKYVVLSDANIAVNFDFKDLIAKHIESGADVTVAYRKEEIPASLIRAEGMSKGLYYTLAIDNGRVTKIYMNSEEAGIQNFAMNIYVMDREFLINEINTAFVRGQVYFERDILAPQVDRLNIQAYEFTGYAARITDIKGYFHENMKLLNSDNLDGLFAGNPIYTKIRDDNPTRYMNCSKAKNIMAADGCVIEGEVENCVIFGGVKIGADSVVKNCIIMHDTVIGENVKLDCVISDKNVKISPYTTLKGNRRLPLVIPKGSKI